MAKISSGSGFVKTSESSRNNEVTINNIDEMRLVDSIDSFRSRNAHGIVGVIANSVQRAMTLGSELSDRFGTDKVTVNHSRFLTTDRLVKDAKVLEIAGKNSNRETFQIIVGTQVLEQSLDIDFDILYSDIAPLASLIQRMGRLHRHDRPLRKLSPEFVLIREEPKNGSEISEPTAKLIYGDWLIHVAESFLENRSIIYIPQQIEEIIEWLPEEYTDNGLYREFIENNENVRKKKTRDFTLKRPPAPRPNRLEKMKQQSLHGCFSMNAQNSRYNNLIEAKVRDIDRPNMEVIAVFEGENGGIYLPVYSNSKRDKLYLNTDGEIGWEEEKSILSSTIKLPFQCSNLRFIEELENRAKDDYERLFLHWQENKMLKGELFMVFSKDGFFKVDNIQLRYDKETGLEIKNV